MILLLGASGYVGQAFASQLRQRGITFIPLTRRAIDYSDFDLLFDYVRKMRPEFIINAAGFRGYPNVDACETAREEVLAANILLPQTIVRVCRVTNTPWGHVSSGSIYQGAKVLDQGQLRVERNLNRPRVRQLFARHPEMFFGFTEWDAPNFSFRHPPCSFYSGSKALAEEAIREIGGGYIWRPRMFFNERKEHGNMLWRLQMDPKAYDGLNSMAHLDDFVRACLELWERRVPYGIYNVVNPGHVTTRQIVGIMQEILKSPREFEFWQDDEEFYRYGAKAPRSNCILDTAKLRAAGIEMRPVTVALESALEKWREEPVADWPATPARLVASKNLASQLRL